MEAVPVSLLMIGMELCLAYLTLSLIDALLPPALSPPLLFLCGYLAALAVSATGKRFRMRSMHLAAANVVAFPVTLALSLAFASPGAPVGISSAVLSFLRQRSALTGTSFLLGCIAPLCAVALWIAGMRMGRRNPTFAITLSEFQFGFAGLLILQFTATESERVIPRFTLAALLFILFSLSALYLSRVEAAGKGRKAGNGFYRYGMLALSLTGVLLAFLLIDRAVTPHVVEHLLAMIKSGFQLAAEWFFRLIEFLAKLLPQPKPIKLQVSPPPAGAVEAAERAARTALIPEWVAKAGRIFVSAMWVVLILVSLWRVSSSLLLRLLGALSKTEGEQYERMEKGFRTDLWILLKTALLLVAAIGDAVMRLIRMVVGSGKGGRGRSSVRFLYHQLLTWAAARGMGKNPSWTPSEYLPVLIRWLPDAGMEFRSITDCYVGVRYGNLEPDETEVRAVWEKWERIKRVYRKKKKRS